MLVFKFVKSRAQAVFYSVLILIVIVAGLGFYVYSDMVHLRQDVLREDNKVLLVTNETVLAGFVFSEKFHVINSNELDGLRNEYLEGNYESLLGEDKKMYIFSKTIFEKLDVETFRFANTAISKEKYMSLLESNEPYQEYQDIAGTDDLDVEQILNTSDYELGSYTDDGVFKGLLFANILKKYFLENKNPFYMFKLYRAGYIKVYPEPIIFKVTKRLPGFGNGNCSNKTS